MAKLFCYLSNCIEKSQIKQSNDCDLSWLSGCPGVKGFIYIKAFLDMGQGI